MYEEPPIWLINDKNIQKQNEQVETQVPCVVQMVGVEIRSTLKR